ncbi:MAG: type II toxin-antitoxin system HicB family antitoxin [Candidatus Gastranaerophilales bacterium]|nr:type II toxin-antitoxin system HicB family antitoxin [Candidatus Gastranaerophilales bacterium]
MKDKTNNVLKYKNYIGSVEYNLTEKFLYGKILFIDDLIMFEGNTIEELENSFKEMVDEYLETCKELGKAPQKAYSGSFNVRTGATIHQALAEIAELENISLNKLIINIFTDFVEENNYKHKKNKKLYTKFSNA